MLHSMMSHCSTDLLTLKHYDSNASTANQPTSDNVYLDGLKYHTPDYSKSNGTSVIDFPAEVFEVVKLVQHSNSIFAICNSTLLLLH